MAGWENSLFSNSEENKLIGCLNQNCNGNIKMFHAPLKLKKSFWLNCQQVEKMKRNQIEARGRVWPGELSAHEHNSCYFCPQNHCGSAYRPWFRQSWRTMNSAVKGHVLTKRRESLGHQLCLSGTPEDKGEPGAKTMSPRSLGTDEKIALVMSRAVRDRKVPWGHWAAFPQASRWF